MPDPPRPQNERLVGAPDLRRLFAEQRYEERARAGELTTSVKPGTEYPAPERLGEPPGTVSHILRYFDERGVAVAMAHEYILPDGSIGGIGHRDPKWLRIADIVYKEG